MRARRSIDMKTQEILAFVETHIIPHQDSLLDLKNQVHGLLSRDLQAFDRVSLHRIPRSGKSR